MLKKAFLLSLFLINPPMESIQYRGQNELILKIEKLVNKEKFDEGDFNSLIKKFSSLEKEKNRKAFFWAFRYTKPIFFKFFIESIEKELTEEKFKKLITERDEKGNNIICCDLVVSQPKNIIFLLKKAKEILLDEEWIAFCSPKDENSSTLLGMALSYRKYELLNLLIKNHHPIFYSCESPLNILYKASSENRTDTVELLLARKDSDKLLDITGLSYYHPLLASVEKGHEEVVKLLLNHIKKLLSSDDDWKKFLIEEDNGNTLLAIAVKKGHLEVVKLLLNDIRKYLPLDDEWKKFLNTEYAGKTPLAIAVEKGQVEIAKLLLNHMEQLPSSNDESKKSLNEKDSDELRLAIEKGNQKIANLLLKKSAKKGINIKLILLSLIAIFAIIYLKYGKIVKKKILARKRKILERKKKILGKKKSRLRR